MAEFLFELVSPEKVSFSGQVEAVTLPAEDGEIMVLSGHAPLIANLKTGILTIATTSNEKNRFLITGGFLDAGTNSTTVLAENAYNETEWSAELLDRELEKCEAARDSCEIFEDRVFLEYNINTLKQLKTSVSG